MHGRDVGFIGGGRIARILIQAMHAGKVPIDGMVVSDSSDAVRAELASRFPTIEVTSDNRRPAERRIVFLALHPPALKEVLPAVAPSLTTDGVLVSLAPVLTFADLRRLLGRAVPLVRMIPNAPTLVCAGFNPVCFTRETPGEARADLERLFDVFGEHPEVEEEMLEAYAILTAMGPTYFWFQWQELRKLGASFGLTPEETDVALVAMIRGAAALLFDSGLSFEEVEDSVPVKPLADTAARIREAYALKLGALHRKLKGL